MTTVRDVLFGDVFSGPGGALGLAAEQAAEQLAARGAIPGLPTARTTIARTTIARVGEALDIELSGVLVGGFQLGTALMRAARETAASPGSYRQVKLKTVTIPWEHEIDIEVLVNRRNVASATYIAAVDLTITALAVIVRDGAIAAVTGGDGEVRAALNARTTGPVKVTIPLASARRSFDPRAELPIPGRGLPLLPRRRGR